MAVKGALLDRLSVKATAAIAVAFIGLLFIIAVAGVNSPAAAVFKDYAMTIPCSRSGCNATGRVFLSDLTPWNQATWLTMRMDRPQATDPSTGTTLGPALLDVGVEFDLRWWGTIALDGSAGATGGANVSHLTRVFCPPRQTTCSSVLLLSQPWIQARSYDVRATFADPLAQWYSLTPHIKPEVTFTFRQGYIDTAYTSFELGVRVFFIVFTSFFFLYYLIRMCTGPGNKDEQTGDMLKPSPQQALVITLGALLWWFDDPMYLAYITMPTILTAGAQAFFTATFVALLLLWFLVAFDLARLQGENGVGWDPTTADPATRPGVCFWLPKALLIAIIWTLTLAAYVYVRYSQLTDPAFSVVEAAGPFWGWLQTFVAGLGALYVIYAFIILVLAFRRFKTMSQSNKFVLAVTVTSLLVILAGLFTSSFAGTRNGGGLRLAVYGCANLYVWFLFIIYLPAPRPEGWVAAASSDSGRTPAGPGAAPALPGGGGLGYDAAGPHAEAVPAPTSAGGSGGAMFTGSSGQGKGQQQAHPDEATGSSDSDVAVEVEGQELDVKVGSGATAAAEAEEGPKARAAPAPIHAPGMDRDREERVRRMSGKGAGMGAAAIVGRAGDQ